MPSPVAAQKARLVTLLSGVTEGEAHRLATAALDLLAREDETALVPPLGLTAADDGTIAHATATTVSLLPPLPPLAHVDGSAAGATVSGRVLAVTKDIAKCSTSATSDVVIFVSKMMPVKMSELSQRDLAVVNASMGKIGGGVGEAAGAEGMSLGSHNYAGDGEVRSCTGRLRTKK